MLIYIIGFMGSGKSTIGKQLAKKINHQFIDFDELVEEQSGKKISEIFKDEGQQAFRNIETEILKNISGLKDTVVSTGGGTPCFYDNMKLMNETGITVYIRMPAGSLFHRLAQSKTKRPLIEGLTDLKLMDFIMDTLAEREHFYMQAQHVVKGESLKAEKILEILKK
ncbi:MAG TPA: shikimate kinase [Bacteroidia bacterium]|nr:shikimate kinase [Bacteroidia bacterium]